MPGPPELHVTCIPSIRQDLHVAESPLDSPSGSMGRSSSGSSTSKVRTRSTGIRTDSRDSGRISPTWTATKSIPVTMATDEGRKLRFEGRRLSNENIPKISDEFSPAFKTRSGYFQTQQEKKRKDSEANAAVLWIYCARPALERARPLFNGLKENNVEVVEKSEEDLRPDAEAPTKSTCHALLVLWSPFFSGPHGERLVEICDAARGQGIKILNDVRKLQNMQDRRWLLKALKDHALPTPHFVQCTRDGGPEIPETDIEEYEDYIVVENRMIKKPFVEKPVDRRDRQIYVYYPRAQGGGRALLSTRESGDVPQGVHFDPNGKIRKEGSFIYQEYLQSEGFVVQVICVGGNSYGNAVLAGVGKAALAKSGVSSPEPCPVWLRQEEKIMASKLQVILAQTLFGLTLLRSQTASGNAISYIIDVWPGIPSTGLGAHNHDVVRALQQSMKIWRGAFSRARSLPKYSAEEGGGEDNDNRSCATPRSRLSDASYMDKSGAEGDSEEADLICVLLVARHSERTPKQKVKAKVSLPSDYSAGMLLGWLQGDMVGPEDILGNPRGLELRAKKQLVRLQDAARSLKNQGYDVGSLTDALDCISKEGATFHAKVGCEEGRLVIGLKWGGELTAAGISDAEEFGREFRLETYPKEDMDELLATLRHDIKIYASKESRC